MLHKISPQFESAPSQQAAFELGEGECLELHVFLDRSIIEVFANNRLCLTKRIYPSLENSLGVYAFAVGGRATIPQPSIRGK